MSVVRAMSRCCCCRRLLVATTPPRHLRTRPPAPCALWRLQLLRRTAPCWPSATQEEERLKLRKYWVQERKTLIVYRYVDWIITASLQMIERI